ncbi:MAG: YbaB/EbfC family nucleoid-associated protein [Candidatus Firestonebacteria bacterium]
MFDKLKDIYDLQKQASNLKKELGKMLIEAEEGNGSIKIVINGEQKVQSITIGEEWLSVTKKKDLEEVLKKCFIKAVEKVQIEMVSKLGPMAKNLKLPF